MGKKDSKKKKSKKKEKAKDKDKNKLGKGLAKHLKLAIQQHGAEVARELVTALIATIASNKKRSKTQAKLTEEAKAAISKEADAAIETIAKSSSAAKEQTVNSANGTSATPDAVVLVKVEISEPTEAASAAEVPVTDEATAEQTKETTSADTSSENDKQ